MSDKDTGIAIRFIKQLDRVRTVDLGPTRFVFETCRTLGHAFKHNDGDTKRNVCGAEKPREEA